MRKRTIWASALSFLQAVNPCCADIIEAAGQKPNILFPIFTNGTFMDERYFDLFDKRRNLIPIMSIEGEKEITDAMRGSGIYDRLIANMDELHKRGLIFGASVTVTQKTSKKYPPPIS